ncbi:membrane-associated 30 kDa protein, chloroplastic-like [Lactuca sativa]|uniref:membrane-associated 30 kDa protein, chloroplastic-like n=1 Tax=Lactuca sativa TaxID=4236 RepID=UPI001C692C6A|nr:membrane-associated 30 kDa protein, chloroplastic-like [Lactuca sativa]
MGFHFRTASCCSLFASKLTESGNLVYNAREGAKRPKDEPQLALSKGDEDLAREALKRRKSYAENAASLRTQLDQQKGVMDNLVNNTRILESKIQEAKSKKDTLKARAQSAKTATKVSEMLGNVNTSSALSAFEKMEEKVMTMESQAEALNQLTTDDLEGRYFAMLESSSVDDDLASLKNELSGKVFYFQNVQTNLQSLFVDGAYIENAKSLYCGV